MKYTHPELETVFDTDNGCYNTLIIEEPRFLTRLLTDLVNQLQGHEGEAVMSDRDTPLPFSKNAALLDTFVPFELNRKPLLTLVNNALAKAAALPEYFDQTGALMGDMERWLQALAFRYPCDIVFTNTTPAALIKAAAPEIRTCSEGIAERVLDYMELVETFDRRRLFFTLNMRSYVPDEEMNLFVDTLLDHEYPLIAIESSARPRLPREERTLVDIDLCEIG